LNIQQVPAHGHTMFGSADPVSTRGPKDGVLGRAGAEAYASEFTPGSIAPQTLGLTGGSQPHTNFQSYLCVSFIISLFGIFPPQS
jgi:microcystin-dependent protein